MKKVLLGVAMLVSAGWSVEAAPGESAPKVGVQFFIIEQTKPRPPVLRFLVRPIEGGKGQHNVNVQISVANQDIGPDPADGYRRSHNLLLKPVSFSGLCKNQRPLVKEVVADDVVRGTKSGYRPTATAQLDGQAAEVVILGAADGPNSLSAP
jgi:hypothetical protein